MPTHQGRAAERILFSLIGGEGKTVPNNTHFDTTRANVEFTGAEAVDLVIAGPRPASEHPFKGNMDLEALELIAAADSVPVFMTVTNNAAAASRRLENLRGRPRRLHSAACRCSSMPAASPRTPNSSRPASPELWRIILEIAREISS